MMEVRKLRKNPGNKKLVVAFYKDIMYDTELKFLCLNTDLNQVEVKSYFEFCGIFCLIFALLVGFSASIGLPVHICIAMGIVGTCIACFISFLLGFPFPDYEIVKRSSIKDDIEYYSKRPDKLLELIREVEGEK